MPAPQVEELGQFSCHLRIKDAEPGNVEVFHYKAFLPISLSMMTAALVTSLPVPAVVGITTWGIWGLDNN